MNEQADNINDTILIQQEPIDLVRALKLDTDISGGGEAKMLIVEGMVLLNGEVETRKRKKVFAGDVLVYQNKTVKIVLAEAKKE